MNTYTPLFIAMQNPDLPRLCLSITPEEGPLLPTTLLQSNLWEVNYCLKDLNAPVSTRYDPSHPEE
jgi:hypothetical protein